MEQHLSVVLTVSRAVVRADWSMRSAWGLMKGLDHQERTA